MVPIIGNIFLWSSLFISVLQFLNSRRKNKHTVLRINSFAVIGVFLKQKLENKPYTVVGDGTQKRDFIYVTDVVKAFYLAATSKISSEVFNVGSANPQTINKLIELIGDGEKVYLPSRPGEPLTTHADISKIKKMLNWKPSVSFETGVNEMLKNISYWENAPLWNKEKIENATEQWFKYLK